jgi:nucleotide sugar dehydrogenase
MTRVAIVGRGFVGAGMQKIFPDATIIDPPKKIGSFRDTIGMDLALVCVPTPMSVDGSCDTSIVEEAVSQIRSDLILIKSTVTPGTTDRLAVDYGNRICFSPEYMGESKYFVPDRYLDPTNPVRHGFMIIGGEQRACSDIADIFLPILGPTTRFRFMRAVEAELVKYFENTYFSMKVTFANELRRICNRAGVNYHVVREGWLDDPRVDPMHTAAFAQAPGFSGKCLPKDTNALAAYCRQLGAPSTLLEAILAANRASQQ